MASLMHITAKFDGRCFNCSKTIAKGAAMVFKPGSRTGRKGGGTPYCSMTCAGGLADDPPPVVGPAPVAGPVPKVGTDEVPPEDYGEGEPPHPQWTKHEEGDENVTETSNVEAVLRAMIRAESAKVEHKQTIDEEAVKRIVDEAVAKVGVPEPRIIEIRQPEKPAVTIEGAHYQFERLVKLVGAGIPCYLWGPAGSGKTTAAMQAAKALSREVEIDTLDPSTFRSMVQGYMTPDGKPVHTSFTRCWENGKLYIADECDNGPGHVHTLFNSALANGHAPFAWGNAEKGKGFGFLGTGNTPGMPTRAFPDRRPMGAAFKDRLYFMYWPIDKAIEARYVGNPEPKAPARKVEKVEPKDWVRWVTRLRAWAVTNMPTLMITPRASITGIQALALGESFDEVADAMIFRGCDAEMRTKAVNAVSL